MWKEYKNDNGDENEKCRTLIMNALMMCMRIENSFIFLEVTQNRNRFKSGH